MKRLLIVFVALLVGAVSHGEPVDFLVAKVDDEAFTWSDVLFERELQRVEGVYVEEKGVLPLVEQLIRRKLLVAEAERMRLRVEQGKVAAKADELIVSAGGEEALTTLTAIYGYRRPLLYARMRELLLSREFLSLRREMIFVSETETRAFYKDQFSIFGDKPFSEVRDDVRGYLASRKHKRELDRWIEEQVALGRVVRLELPEGASD